MSSNQQNETYQRLSKHVMRRTSWFSEFCKLEYATYSTYHVLLMFLYRLAWHLSCAKHRHKP